MVALPLLKDAVWAAQDDVLGHAPATATLGHAVLAISAPACIAVYGSWGAGKTTFLRSIFEAQKRAGGAAVWFDPWEHEQRADVLSPLLRAIVSYAEDTNKADAARIRFLATGIAKTLWSLGVQAGAHWLFGDNKKLKPLAELKGEDLTRNFGSWSAYHSEIDGIKKDFKSLVDTALGERSEGSLLIFLDDLDRCLPDSVVKLLEGVKLLLCGRDDCRVIFVFGLDRQIVGEAIAQRYPTSSSYSGESYLEKIFDLSLEIPSPSSQQIQALIARAWPDSLARAVAAVFEPFGGSGLVSQVLADPVFANPRIIKRVLNRLALFARCSQAKAFLSRLTTEPDRRRFLTWTAGAERFRGFRYGFMAATSGEIEGLHAFVASGDDRQLVGRMSMIARAPGFRRYYMLLGLEGHDWMSVDRQRNATGAGQLGAPALSLRDFDDVLRGVGL